MTVASANGIDVVAARHVDDELAAAFGRLLPQLSENADIPTLELIRAIVDAPATRC